MLRKIGSFGKTYTSLRAFASGKSFYLAARQTRELLQGLEDDFLCATWLPILYHNPAEAPLAW
ncbi:MAG TPA: hypothetical protein V6C90_14760 [Coleofasciculaceae cyanobacterium]